jgi:hypothetical protein
MPKLDTTYRLTGPVMTSDVMTDESLSFTARGILVKMTHEACSPVGDPISLRSLMAAGPGIDTPEELANGLAELVRAGLAAPVE